MRRPSKIWIIITAIFLFFAISTPVKAYSLFGGRLYFGTIDKDSNNSQSIFLYSLYYSKVIWQIEAFAELNFFKTRLSRDGDFPLIKNANYKRDYSVNEKFKGTVLQLGVKKVVPLFKIKRRATAIGGEISGFLNFGTKNNITLDINRYEKLLGTNVTQNHMPTGDWELVSWKPEALTSNSHPFLNVGFDYKYGIYQDLYRDENNSVRLFVGWGYSSLEPFKDIRNIEFEGETLDTFLSLPKGGFHYFSLGISFIGF